MSKLAPIEREVLDLVWKRSRGTPAVDPDATAA